MFCKIVAGDLPAQKLMEDANFMAFLGIFPRFPGMTVVVTKKHLGSYLYQTGDDKILSDMHIFAKKMALAIDKSLGSIRCIQIMEGFDVGHAHLKLFPVYDEKPYNVSYEGTRKATEDELKNVAEKIRKAV